MKSLYFNLLKVGLREITRDKRLFFFISIFPFMFLAMFIIMGKFVPHPKSLTIMFDEFMFSGVLIFALLGIGLYGTTAPLIDYRRNNTFKLLETTTINKSIFILSQLSVRLVIGLFQIFLFLIIGAFCNYISAKNVVQTLLISSLILIVMLLLGIFLGGIFNSSEIALGILSFLSAPILMLSNVLLPLSIFPNNFKDIAQFFPFAYMGDLLRHFMFNSYKQEYSTWFSIIIIIISSALLLLLTSKTFKFYKKI